jgi:hypothetical protein
LRIVPDLQLVLVHLPQTNYGSGGPAGRGGAWSTTT